MKVKESVLREKISRILKEQRKFGRNLEGFIDAFLLTDRHNFDHLGYFGEKIAEAWCNTKYPEKPVNNLNTLKSKNFPFGDIIVGDPDNLSDAIIYSVKATSVNKVPMENSAQRLSSINEMFIQRGRRGFADEIKDQSIVRSNKPIRLGLITVRPLFDRKEGTPIKIQIKEFSSMFYVKRRGGENLSYYLSTDSGEEKNLTGVIRSDTAAENFFGEPSPPREIPLNRSVDDNEKARFAYEKARQSRDDMLNIFRAKLPSLSNEDLYKIIVQVEEMEKVNTNLAESFGKDLLRVCLDFLSERKRS